MTDADRMVAWLRETMDAAQADAEAAVAATGGPHWHGSDSGLYSNDASNHPGPFLADAYGYTDPRIVAHISRHDPAAALRRITADRKTLNLHTTPHTVVELAVEPLGELFCGDCDGPCTHKGEAECVVCGQDGCDTVRLLAEGWGWTEETT